MKVTDLINEQNAPGRADRVSQLNAQLKNQQESLKIKQGEIATLQQSIRTTQEQIRLATQDARNQTAMTQQPSPAIMQNNQNTTAPQAPSAMTA